jgi:hypothetical protein
LVLPGWQTPFASQQPFGQVFTSQISQACVVWLQYWFKATQFMHVAPFEPQTMSPLSARHPLTGSQHVVQAAQLFAAVGWHSGAPLATIIRLSCSNSTE